MRNKIPQVIGPFWAARASVESKGAVNTQKVYFPLSNPRNDENIQLFLMPNVFSPLTYIVSGGSFAHVNNVVNERLGDVESSRVAESFRLDGASSITSANTNRCVRSTLTAPQQHTRPRRGPVASTTDAEQQ